MMLETDLFGMTFRNPVLNAAGPTGMNADALIKVAEGGAGGLVAKTIGTSPAKVPKPNMYSLGSGGLLNVELWSDIPASRWIKTEYKKVKEKTGLPLIASIGYLPDEVGKLAEKIGTLEDGVVDAIECSVHYIPGGDGETTVKKIVQSVRNACRLPVIIKLSPHGYDIGKYARAAEEAGASAIAAINSLGPCMKIDVETGRVVLGGRGGQAWLSGNPIKPLAVRCVAEISRSVKKIPVIGVGGIMNGRDAVEHIMAGASLVQVCTAGILKGPKIHGIIAAQIEEFMKEHDYKSIEDFRGIALDSLPLENDIREKVARIDKTICTACGLCASACLYGAIEMDETGAPPRIDPETCAGCGLCASICPKHAIKIFC